MAYALQLAVGFFERAAVLLKLFKQVLYLLVLLAHGYGALSAPDRYNYRRSGESQAVQRRSHPFWKGRERYERADQFASRVNRRRNACAQSSVNEPLSQPVSEVSCASIFIKPDLHLVVLSLDGGCESFAGFAPD